MKEVLSANPQHTAPHFIDANIQSCAALQSCPKPEFTAHDRAKSECLLRRNEGVNQGVISDTAQP